MKKNARQAEAFEQLLGHCNTQGDSYKPSDAAMNSTALKALLEESRKSIQAVHDAQRDLVNAINHRHRAFDPLPFLGTRILGAMKACKAPPDLIADVNRIRMRFRYPSSNDPAQRTGPGEQAGQSGSDASIPSIDKSRGPISQLDFKSKISNLTAIVGLLEKEPKYNPVEEDLSLEGLKGKLQELIDSNRAVKDAELNLMNARNAVEKTLYGDMGIYGIATRVKNYFSAVFGFNSKASRAVRKIKFSN